MKGRTSPVWLLLRVRAASRRRAASASGAGFGVVDAEGRRGGDSVSRRARSSRRAAKGGVGDGRLDVEEHAVRSVREDDAADDRLTGRKGNETPSGSEREHEE